MNGAPLGPCRGGRQRPGTSRRALRVFVLFILGVLAVLFVLALLRPRRGVWFRGDFESGDLSGWGGDLARPSSAVVVRDPVRKGCCAVRLVLAPGDVAASKPRVELKLADKEIERRRGGQGGEVWYGWSLLLPADHAHPPGGQFQILAQWHHRPADLTRKKGRRMFGPPPLALYLTPHAGEDLLILIGQASPTAPPTNLGARPLRRGEWADLVFHIRWSTGKDGFVEAWIDGRPFTAGKRFGPTLYSPLSNYLRLGLYRGKDVPTTNHVYLDEVRLGDSYDAVAP